ncbi:MAG: hypothetical protein ACYS0I_17225 [Planctomycetota bacterium]
MMEHKNEIRDTRYKIRTRPGTVLILAIVLTSLLAVIGVMFVLTAQVDKTATSAIAENRELNFAIETVIARISQELVKDVPGLAGDEYYDYPGDKDRWLASLEPYDKGGYKWPQISDVTGYIDQEWGSQKDVDVEIVEDHERIKLYSNGNLMEQLADADGDGVADSKWIKLDNITSNKAKPIYAAIRVVDNGGMLNVNTAYKFDPNDTNIDRIDGSSQLQVNLLAIAKGATESAGDLYAQDLQEERCGGEDSPVPKDLDLYESNVIWRYGRPNGDYTPFDISDELELRYRFLVNQEDIDTRLELLGAEDNRSWLLRKYAFRTPIDESDELNEWIKSACADENIDPNYACRHIATTHNMDRIIDVDGDKMVNVNFIADAQQLYNMLVTDINLGGRHDELDPQFAQIIANIKDYGDPDNEVTVVIDDKGGGTEQYGFERPCIYISELANRFVPVPGSIAPRPLGLIYMSYAIEFHKPYPEDAYPDNTKWQLVITDITGAVTRTENINWSGNKYFHVIVFENAYAPLLVDLSNDPDPNLPNFGSPHIINLPRPGSVVFSAGHTISLQRLVGSGWVTVDSVTVPGGWFTDILSIDGSARSYQRDITLHKCIRRLWDDTGSERLTLTLGMANSYFDPDPKKIQAHPERFNNVGEISKVFRRKVQNNLNWNVGDPSWNGLGSTDAVESEIRCDLADPNIQKLFQYLTVFDPSRDGINNDGDRRPNGTEIIDENVLNETPEWKIPGRININTAPWYVIAQLPWVSNKLAQAIAAYRDMLPDPVNYTDRWSAISGLIDGSFQNDIREEPGFAGIGELNFVIAGDNDYSIRYYQLEQTGDLPGFPDLTPGDSWGLWGGDGAPDDFEERDVIFHRISDLVTVRSDVFTAYILVRIGADGPQKRAIAILDRSGVYPGVSGGIIGNVKILAVHPVPDPR